MEIRRVPDRKTDRLHKGRVSVVGARYFVTMVTRHREPWLTASNAGGPGLAVLRNWHAEGRGRVLAASIMPNHGHILFELGPALTVGQTVARWKSAMRKAAGYAGEFQRDFWEHRVREIEDEEDYALYIFLNPYRAGLLAVECTWPGWWTPDSNLFRFSAGLDGDGAPPAEWVDQPDDRFAGLAVEN